MIIKDEQERELYEEEIEMKVDTYIDSLKKNELK